jgi:5-methylthioadenosine/S-adenosylhomocysteine deaminase
MKTAALLAKVSAGDAAAVPAAAALRLATMGGATALGLAECIGSITKGKWADLTCVDLQNFRSLPIYDPLSQLVYAVGTQQVRDVWVAGRHLVENGKLTQIDAEEILCRTHEWQQRIASQ